MTPVKKASKKADTKAAEAVKAALEAAGAEVEIK